MLTIAPLRTEGRGRRGTAEVEALFAALFLLGILLLAVTAVRINTGRMLAGDMAQYETWRDAYGVQTPQYTSGAFSVAVSGPETLRSEALPNRVHADNATPGMIVMTNGTARSTVTVHEVAIVPGPTWNLSAMPVGGDDRAVTEAWFEGFMQEQVGDVAGQLYLDPAWQP